MKFRLYKLVAAAWIETTKDLLKDSDIIKIEYETGKFETGTFEKLMLKLR